MAKYYDRCWNPVFGCSGRFAGCDQCYAQALMARRGEHDFRHVCINKRQLFKSFDKTGQLIAVCTQSDLFQGAGEANQWLVDTVLAKCDANRQNNYLILTKFASNMLAYLNDDGLLERLNGKHLEPFSFGHIAFGVSVCCQDDLHRLGELRNASHIVHRFVAFEPVLEHIPIAPADLKGMEWVIVGAETGECPYPCKQEWLEEIVGVATSLNIPVFVNAIHTASGKPTAEFEEMPEALRRNDIPFAVHQ